MDRRGPPLTPPPRHRPILFTALVLNANAAEVKIAGGVGKLTRRRRDFLLREKISIRIDIYIYYTHTHTHTKSIFAITSSHQNVGIRGSLLQKLLSPPPLGCTASFFFSICRRQHAHFTSVCHTFPFIPPAPGKVPCLPILVDDLYMGHLIVIFFTDMSDSLLANFSIYLASLQDIC